MRILIANELYTPYRVGGAEISTQLLAETLVRCGHEVHVYTSSDIDSDQIVNGVVVHRRSQHNLYWSYRRGSVSAGQKLYWHLQDMYNRNVYKDFANIVSSIHPDIVHTNVITGFSPSIWHAAKRNGIPVVHTLRDYSLACAKSTMFDQKECLEQCSKCKVLTLTHKKLSQNVDAVVGISQAILKKHLSLGYFSNSRFQEIIPNSVVLQDIKPSSARENIIGFIGRVHPSKGVEFLIDSFLKLSNHNYKLQIAGNGDDEYIDYLKRRYPNKNVEFLGRVDPYPFLSKIELLVVPSLWSEPFGRVIVEANACGVPVLTSNKGGMPELIEEGVNGSVFNLGKEDDLVSHLSQFVSGNLKYQMDKMNLSRYSMENVSANYISLYKRIVNN